MDYSPYYTQQGSCASFPILVSPPSQPHRGPGAHHQQPQPQLHTQPQWNAPMHSLALEAFAWPSMWFDVPSITPPSTGQYPDLLDSLPELDHSDSKTPDSSPVSLRDACTTPLQDNVNVVAVCDVPLIAPRPLPFTPPAFLQFDFLPDDDEDLSFPPYTHSRRRLSEPARDCENQNPRKRHADGDVDAEAECHSLPAISRKRRKAAAAAAVIAASGHGHSHGHGGAGMRKAVAGGRARRIEPAVFAPPPQHYDVPQIMHFGQFQDRLPLMGWI